MKREEMEEEIVCKLWTQEPENFDEEVKSLGTAWRSIPMTSSSCVLISGKYSQEPDASLFLSFGDLTFLVSLVY